MVGSLAWGQGYTLRDYTEAEKDEMHKDVSRCSISTLPFTAMTGDHQEKWFNAWQPTIEYCVHKEH